MVIKRIIVLFILCFFSMQAQGQGQSNAHNSTKAESMIYAYSPYEVTAYIKSTNGQRRALVIYASWCPICMKKMPSTMEIERGRPDSIIAVSVDDSEEAVHRVATRFNHEIPFRLIWSEEGEWALAKRLKRYGARSWDSIPQIMLLDQKGYVAAQGNFSSDQIAAFLYNGKKPAQ